MINLEIRKYIECTLEEKLPLLKRIAEIINLANIARREGVLALEQQIERTDDKLLQVGLGLVCDGTDPELVKEILNITIITSHKTGAELLSQLIVQDGVLQIQAGHNPRIIQEKLLAYTGGDFDAKAYGFYIDQFLGEDYAALMADIANWEKAAGLPEFEMLVNFSGRDMQQVLKEVSDKILTAALRGASYELKKHILQNLSKRHCVDILNNMKFGGENPEAITEAQQEIVNILHRLQKAGEVKYSGK